MIGTLLALALSAAGGLFGHLAYEAGVRPGSPARSLPRTEVLFAKLAATVAFVTWAGIVLSEAGAFGGWTLAALLGLAAVALRTAAPRATAGPTRPQADVLAASLLAIVVVGAIFFYPPFDVRLQARDPGVYYLAGQRLADTGALAHVDPVVEGLTPQELQELFPPTSRPTSRFLGFYLVDRGAGIVVPQALPGLPVWIAIGAAIAGTDGAALATPLLALLALVAITLAVRRVLGAIPASLAGLFLAANFVQAWFARYVAAEILAQALLFVGLYALLQHRQRDDPFYGLLAAAGIGLTWLTKAELAIFVVPLAILLFLDVARGRLTRATFLSLWVPLGLLGAHGVAHAIGWAWPYYSDLLLQFEVAPRTFALVGVVGGLVYGLVLLGVGAARGRGSRGGPELARRGRGGDAIRAALTVMLLGALLYGAWWRPLRFTQRLAAGLINDSWEAHVVSDLAAAVSPELLVLAAVGTALLLWNRDLPRGSRAVLAILAFAACVPLLRRQINPQLLWAYRRWIPATIPWTMMTAAFGAWALCTRVPVALRERARRTSLAVPGALATVAPVAVIVTALALLVGAAVQQTPLALRYASHRELPGTAAAIRDLDALLEPDGLVLFEPRTRRGLVRFEAALAYDRDRRVLRIRRAAMPEPILSQLVGRHGRGARPVYLVTTGWLSWPGSIGAEHVADFEFHSQRLEEQATYLQLAAGRAARLPEETPEFNLRAAVYRLRPGRPLASLAGELDVGGADVLYLEGPTFYEKEADPSGRSFRWTFPDAEVRLPGLGAAATTIRITLEDDTPPIDGGRWFDLSLDGVPLGRRDIAPDWNEYEFAIPEEWQPGERAPRLTITSEGFRPVDLGLGTDRRMLGVKVDRVRW